MQYRHHAHLPHDWLRHCLHDLAPSVKAGGSFFASHFHCPEDWPEDQPRFDAA